MQFCKRKGIFLPLVLFILVVLAFLGMYLNRSAMHEFRFTYRSADNLRATYIAEGAIHAAMAHIKEHMNNTKTDQGDNFRKQFTDDGASTLFTDAIDLDLEYLQAIIDLKESLNSLDEAEIIDECDFKITELKAQLSESHLIQKSLGSAYSDRTKKLIVTCNVEYKSAGGEFRYGSKARFNKKITQCFDVKITDIRPVGNKYALIVSKTQTEDFNTKGGHLWIKYQDKEGKSLGISIGNSPIIDLYKRYHIHIDYNTCIVDPRCDLFTADPNSLQSLIPGWDPSMDTSFNPGAPYVPDNEPWTNVFVSPGMILMLANLDNAIPSGAPVRGGPGPHVLKHMGAMCLLDTGAGIGVEPGGCGPGIPFQPVKHPITGNKYFQNSGLDSGRTHLFYKNCSDPCPIFGNVLKRWLAYSHTAIDDSDSGVNPCRVQDPTCGATDKDCWSCTCHHLGEFYKWDGWFDMCNYMLAGPVTGQYQVKIGGMTWSAWSPTPIKIDSTLNFKSQSDFFLQTQYCAKDFLKGATRSIKNLSQDPNLLDNGKLYLEGMIHTNTKERINYDINQPGCILCTKWGPAGMQQLDIEVARSNYNLEQNPFFAQPTALSIVTNGVAHLSSANVYAGICALKSVNGTNIKLNGNLVTEQIYKDTINGEILFDSTIKKMSDNNYGNSSASDACFVVTISPIPQETFDWMHLKN